MTELEIPFNIPDHVKHELYKVYFEQLMIKTQSDAFEILNQLAIVNHKLDKLQRPSDQQ